jgi:hypothetical protein
MLACIRILFQSRHIGSNKSRLFFLAVIWCSFLQIGACSSPSPVPVPPPVQPVQNLGLTQPNSALEALPPSSTPVPTQSERTTSEPPTATPIPEIIITSIETSGLDFDSFVVSVKNGKPEEIVGVYVQNVLALPVIQQPSDSNGKPLDPGFVSRNDNEATQFLYAYIFANGNIGLIAHNFLAGRFFFDLTEGDPVELIYGDGSVEEYVINHIEEYQALFPESATSDFVDLITGETISATDLFTRVYGGEKRVTFQTCVDRDNNASWGRLFPIAFPGN